MVNGPELGSRAVASVWPELDLLGLGGKESAAVWYYLGLGSLLEQYKVGLLMLLMGSEGEDTYR